MRFLVAVIAALLLLSACIGGEPPETRKGEAGEGLRVVHVSTDGREITCIIFDSAGYAGGISCDW